MYLSIKKKSNKKLFIREIDIMYLQFHFSFVLLDKMDATMYLFEDSNVNIEVILSSYEWRKNISIS